MKIFLLIIVIFFSASTVQANDSVASVAAGGLELLKTDDIQMVSEELEISTRKIKVKYRFLNTSDKDIKTTVAFPMPPFADTEFSTPQNATPLRSFQSFVNGTKVNAKMHRVFMDKVGGKDLTATLRKIGLTDEQIFRPDFDCIDLPPEASGNTCKISQDQYSQIKKIISSEDGVIQETAYWEQTFQAGKEIEVIHEYKPFTGAHMIQVPGEYYSQKDISRNNLPAFTRTQLDTTSPLDNHPKSEACLDDRTFKSIIKRVQEIPHQVTMFRVDYILGTGRNWKGPIKNFRLILHKEGGLVSLCFPGKSRSIDKNTIEFAQNDFVPQDMLTVFFYITGDNRSEYNRYRSE
jgi:hypothetical protein